MTLGILGGLGPAATVYFYDMLTSMTQACCDQDHLDIVISSRASTPDRTAYILGTSDNNPAEYMVEDARKLVAFGADVIAIPCNTAHYFYDVVKESVDATVINIIEESCRRVKISGGTCIGILATEGTVKAQAYHMMAHSMGLECVAPSSEGQAIINSIIYDRIKQGKDVDIDAFMGVAQELFELGADRIVLGCTELSLLCREYHFDSRFVDSLKTLALSVLKKFNKTVVEK
jgi:aspartate racemase